MYLSKLNTKKLINREALLVTYNFKKVNIFIKFHEWFLFHGSYLKLWYLLLVDLKQGKGKINFWILVQKLFSNKFY